MDRRDADKKAEKLERPGTVGGGTAENTGVERQAAGAPGEKAGEGAPATMEEVLRRENLMAAYKRVVRNRGAGGVDGRSVDDLKHQIRTDWPRIREQLLSGTYVPSPVRKVEIPKPGGGGVRMLGIPTVMDRMIQQALQQVLTLTFDPTFSEDSYGFRPGRSTHQAVSRGKEHVVAGHQWVVDLDLAKFFDKVQHDVLMSRVARRVKDKRILCVIGRYLRAGIMEDGVVSPRAEGTPQGGPLSPLLSNVLLDDLDKELERRGHRFVRYADDFQVYVKSKAAGERVMASLERFLEKRLRLKVNREKSAVDRPWNRKFLGYRTFLGYRPTVDSKPKLQPAPQSVKRLKQKLKVLFRRGRGWSIDRTIAELNPILRGWGHYYRLADVDGVFADLDKWIRRRLRLLLWRQWKQPRTRVKELRKRGLNPSRATTSAYNGRGPWWNAGAQHMNRAVPISTFSQRGLVSLLDQHRRLMSAS